MQKHLKQNLGILLTILASPYLFSCMGSNTTEGKGDDSGSTSIAQISTSGTHTCALSDNGAIYCWGHNNAGEIGNGTVSNNIFSKTPPNFITNNSMMTIATTYNSTMSLDSTGQIYAWGDNRSGQLGLGYVPASENLYYVLTPQPVITPTNTKKFIYLATHDSSSCGIADDHQIYCWGSDSMGQLGDGGSTTVVTKPQLVSQNLQGINFSKVDVSDSHGCAIDSGTNQAYCWGDNKSGEIGNGTFSPNDTPLLPTLVNGNLQFIDISVGNNLTCAISTAHQLYCWGQWLQDQAANSTPVQIQTSILFNTVVSSTGFTCAISDSGALYCFGTNNEAGLGNGVMSSDNLVKVKLPNGIFVEQISLSPADVCLSSKSGTAFCWGLNNLGQLGDGTKTDSLTPVVVKFNGNK